MVDFQVNIEINDKNIYNKLDQLLDENVMLQIHALYAELIEPWVPYDTGALVKSTTISPYGVTYGGGDVDYAYDQYTNLFYGHRHDIHPLASAFWDKAAMDVKRDEFLAGVKDILSRRAKELYG